MFKGYVMRPLAFLKYFLLIFVLGSCALDQEAKQAPILKETASLAEQVHALVVGRQEKAVNALSPEIASFVSSEPVASREKNQKGAGFTRVYQYGDGEAIATVFIYNNQDFGITGEITPAMEALMDRHLSEMQAMQDSGLYTQVKIGAQKTREFKARGIKYQVLETDVAFVQKDEPKISYFALGGNRELMSFIRIRITYPRAIRARMQENRTVFVREVFRELNEFASGDQNRQ